jgi:Mg2+ and Co2+ transporter CorA
LYIFLEQRWIITINFNSSQQLESNIKQRISRSLTPSHHRSVPIPLSEQGKQQQSPSSGQRNFDSNSSYSRAIFEMVYRFAIEEVISSYYPILNNINVKLEQIEDQYFTNPQSRSSQTYF